MRERNTPGLIRVGDMEMAGIGAMGVTEIDAVGTTETIAENVVKTGATGAARGVAIGISVFAATLGSSKVSVIKGMDMQNEGRPQQRGDTHTHTHTHIYI